MKVIDANEKVILDDGEDAIILDYWKKEGLVPSLDSDLTFDEILELEIYKRQKGY